MADLSVEATQQPTVQAARSAGNPTFGIAVGASPFTYTAPYPMAVLINGGSVSLIQYGRGGALLSLGLLGGLIELNTGDSLKVTYLTVPVLTAIPR